MVKSRAFELHQGGIGFESLGDEGLPIEKGSDKFSRKRGLTLVQISDFHVGSVHFVSNLMNRTIMEVNAMSPDLVIATGDLTNEGFKQEYNAVQAYMDQIDCDQKLVIPGNHDSRNVGYVHFEERFGERHSLVSFPGVTVVGIDSSEPDLDRGRVGRSRYKWILEKFEDRAQDFKVVALHHHLLPVPGTGRERNIIDDAGDMLAVLIDNGINLVLNGHKHVPHVWSIEGMYVVTAGTASSLRLRGYNQPCYNIIKLEDETCRIYRKVPFGKQEIIAEFSSRPRTRLGSVGFTEPGRMAT